jgi:hypothetical protein
MVQMRGERVPKQTSAEAIDGKRVPTCYNAQNRSGEHLSDCETDQRLSRTVNILTAEIGQQEERAAVRDVSDPTYPVPARSLRERRDNIRVTITALEALVQRTTEAA